MNRTIKFTHLPSINSRIFGSLWMAQLSITMTDFGLGNGRIFCSRSSIKVMNKSVLYDPSIIMHSSMPNSEIAGSIEYLKKFEAALSWEEWWQNIPLSSCKILFSASSKAFQSPSSALKVSSSVAGTFIDKHKLLRSIVRTDTKTILRSV